MGNFKYYMLKMTVSDLLFSFSLSFLFLPNLLFPLPAATTAGLMKYFGKYGGIAAYVMSLITGASSMLSVMNCCIYRLFTFYSVFEQFLATLVKYRMPLLFAEVSFLCVFLSVGPYLNLATFQELVAYAKRHNHSDMLENLTTDTPFVAFDLDELHTTLVLIMFVNFFVFCGAFNGISNYAVQRKVIQMRSSMSTETFRMQKSLTFILLAQVIIPGFSLAIPIAVYCVAMFFFLDDVLKSPVVEWGSVLIVGAYPFINSIFCLYSMKPYRKFTTNVVKKTIFCYKWRDETSVMAEPTGSSSNQAS